MGGKEGERIIIYDYLRDLIDHRDMDLLVFQLYKKSYPSFRLCNSFQPFHFRTFFFNLFFVTHTLTDIYINDHIYSLSQLHL